MEFVKAFLLFASGALSVFVGVSSETPELGAGVGILLFFIILVLFHSIGKDQLDPDCDRCHGSGIFYDPEHDTWFRCDKCYK